MKIELGQILSQIISFLIMLWILKKYGWKPILNGLEARRNSIKEEWDKIENEKNVNLQLRRKYEEKLEEIDAESKVKIRESMEKASKIALEVEQRAHEEAKAIINKAQKDALIEIEKAKVQFKNEIVNLTLLTTEKVLKSTLNDDKQKQMILNFVNKQGKE